MARTAEKPKEGMGARVERERIKRGWSQEDLAARLNTTRSSIKNKELGERPFSLDEAKILCEAFHVTLDYLVNGNETENVPVSEILGLSDEAIYSLRYINERAHSRLKGLDMALSSPALLIALSRYMTYTPADKGYYLSESGSYEHGKLIECRMSQELFGDVLKQNILHMAENAKAGNYNATRYFEAYADFAFDDELDAKLAEPSEPDYDRGKGNAKEE